MSQQRKIQEFFHNGSEMTSLVAGSSTSSLTSSVEVSHLCTDDEQEEIHSQTERMNEAPDLINPFIGNSTGLVEDLHSQADDQDSPEQDKVNSAQSKADESTVFYDTATSTTSSFSSMSSSSSKICKCQCYSKVSSLGSK